MQESICLSCCHVIYLSEPCTHCGHDPASPPPAAKDVIVPGRTLGGGRYMVGRVIGRGGFGVTYAGFDLMFSRRVAIKEYFPESATRAAGGAAVEVSSPPLRAAFEAERDKFLREAQTLSQFGDLPTIVTAFDFFNDNGTAYLVLRFVDGHSFDALLRSGTPLSARQVVAWILAALDALHQVHSRGVNHRDIKPSNLMLTPDGEVVIIDFGAARPASAEHLTAYFTPGYAPPESFEIGGARCGPWTDVYGMGATMYHMLTGRFPPGAPHRVGGVAVPPIDRRDVSAALKACIDRAIALEPSDRHQSAADFAAELRAVPEAPASPVSVISSKPIDIRSRDRSSKAGSPGPSVRSVVPRGPILWAFAIVLAVVGGGLYATGAVHRLFEPHVILLPPEPESEPAPRAVGFRDDRTAPPRSRPPPAREVARRIERLASDDRSRWEAEVRATLLNAYDFDRSGMLDHPNEAAEITCQVYWALMKASGAAWRSMGELNESASLDVERLGFAAHLRGPAHKRVKGCGLLPL